MIDMWRYKLRALLFPSNLISESLLPSRIPSSPCLSARTSRGDEGQQSVGNAIRLRLPDVETMDESQTVLLLSEFPLVGKVCRGMIDDRRVTGHPPTRSSRTQAADPPKGCVASDQDDDQLAQKCFPSPSFICVEEDLCATHIRITRL